MNSRRSILFSVLVVAGVTYGYCLTAEADPSESVVVIIDRDPQGIVYRVDSQVTPSDELLHRLDEKLVRSQRPPPLFVLAHQDVSLSTIENVRLLAVKAGYGQPRVFYFQKNKNWMTELKFSQAVPFSDDGNVLDSVKSGT